MRYLWTRVLLYPFWREVSSSCPIPLNLFLYNIHQGDRTKSLEVTCLSICRTLTASGRIQSLLLLGLDTIIIKWKENKILREQRVQQCLAKQRIQNVPSVHNGLYIQASLQHCFSKLNAVCSGSETLLLNVDKIQPNCGFPSLMELMFLLHMLALSVPPKPFLSTGVLTSEIQSTFL